MIIVANFFVCFPPIIITTLFSSITWYFILRFLCDLVTNLASSKFIQLTVSALTNSWTFDTFVYDEATKKNINITLLYLRIPKLIICGLNTELNFTRRC